MEHPEPPPRYRLPDDTDASVRTLGLVLSVFFAALLAAVGLVVWQAQTIAAHVPFAAEQRFVRPYEPLIGRAFADERGDPDVGRRLQALADELRAVMKTAPDIEVRVHYLDGDEINAFATLGGHVVVFRGLLEALPDENSLAMVLAHEIAHVAHRDPAAGLGRGLALELLLGFVTGGGTSAGDVAELLGGSGLALFGREQERAADLAALHALARRYGHVGGYRDFLEIARKMEREGGAPVGWLASHPASAERLRLLDAARRASGYSVGPTAPPLAGETLSSR